LAERWGVSLRTVQRRISTANLQPVGVQDRLPHFHKQEVEAYESRRSISPRPGRSHSVKRPIFSVCIAHRKGGQSKTSSCFYLARELSAAGKRVVLRDLDAQRSLTKILRTARYTRGRIRPVELPAACGAGARRSATSFQTRY